MCTSGCEGTECLDGSVCLRVGAKPYFFPKTFKNILKTTQNPKTSLKTLTRLHLQGKVAPKELFV